MSAPLQPSLHCQRLSR